MKRTIQLFCLFLITILISSISISQSNPTTVSFSGYISKIGCHNVDGICYGALKDGAGSSINVANGCPSMGEFRFDNGDTIIGSKTYNSLFTSFEKGYLVSLTVSGCTSQGFPKVIYYNIFK